MFTSNQLIYILFSIPGIIIATTLHEFVRAAVSTYFGDTLPKQKGRLTLNPIKHFEPIGFILMLSTGFGWGKPVDTSSLYYKNRKRDTLLTAILPTIANLIFAILISIIVFLLMNYAQNYILNILTLIVYYNISIAVYNIVPVSPMDGLKVLSNIMPSNQYFKLMQYEKIIQILFLLLLFMGLGDFIFSPIINFIYFIISRIYM